MVGSVYGQGVKAIVTRLEITQQNGAILLPASFFGRDCTLCGACCAAPDIAALEKPLGVPCQHLQPDCTCSVYAQRPQVCRNYTVDWVCGEVAPLLRLEDRVRRYLEIYGLTVKLKE